MKKKLNKAIALAAMMSLAFGIVGSNLNVYKADAATSLQNIFTEALEETTMEDNNRWVRPKTDSVVEIKNIGRQTLCIPSDGLAVGFQYNEQINLQDGQYVEMALTFENMNPAAVIDFAFTGEKAVSYETLSAQNPESVSFYADFAWLRGQLTSTNAQHLYGGWGNVGNAGEAMGLQWVNGNSVLGAPEVANGKYKMKVRIYDDGTAVYYIANPYGDNYFATAVVGHNILTNEKVAGYNALKSGYMHMTVRNVTDAYIGDAEIAYYNYTEKMDPAVGIVDGTLVENSYVYEDYNVDSANKFGSFTGTPTPKAATKAILVDNAADDDMLVKKTKLSKPNNTYADNIYNMNFKLMIPELSGTAKAVLYFGGTSQKDFSTAEKVEFTKTAQGVIQMTAGGKTANTELKTGEAFTLEVNCGGDNINKILINGAPVRVTGKKNLEFEKNLIETFVAIGTTGVNAENKAQIGVLQADFKKFNYEQGTGGDFVETFENGMYNKANMSFYYRVENPQDYFYPDKEDGTLVSNNPGYSSVISTKQTYGDFEFTFEIKEWLTFTDENGTTLPCNFAITWGRPAAEADYAAGGGVAFLAHGADFNLLDPALSFAPGYSSWFSVNLPTDATDENGNTLEKAPTVWDYNFSEGNLVFKTVKTGTTVSIYMYTAESPADDPSRTNPVTVIINDYSPAGMVGLCGVPTGKLMGMKLDSFAVKNMDEHKLDNLIVGTDADVVELDLTPVVDTPIEDPFENQNSSSSNENNNTDDKKSGCGSMVSGLWALPAVLATVAFVKKHEDR